MHDMDWKERFPPELAEVAKAFTYEQRLAIIAALDECPARFSDLMAETNLGTGALAPHLRLLQNSGIVRKVAQLRDGVLNEYYEVSPFGRRALQAIDYMFGAELPRAYERSSDAALGAWYFEFLQGKAEPRTSRTARPVPSKRPELKAVSAGRIFDVVQVK